DAATPCRAGRENGRAAHTRAASDDRELLAHTLVRIGGDLRHSAGGPARGYERGRAVVERGVRAESDVEDDDAAASGARGELAALERSVREGDIGARRFVRLSRGRVDSGRNVERLWRRAPHAHWSH